jgi:hypothetical protein
MSLTAEAVLLAADALLKALIHAWLFLEPLHAAMAINAGRAKTHRIIR